MSAEQEVDYEAMLAEYTSWADDEDDDKDVVVHDTVMLDYDTLNSTVPPPSVNDARVGFSDPSVSDARVGFADPSVNDARVGSSDPSVNDARVGFADPSVSDARVGFADPSVNDGPLPPAVAPPPAPIPLVASANLRQHRDRIEALLQQARVMQQTHGDTTEIEVRLGQASRHQFESGVPATTFDALMAVCRRVCTKPPEQSNTTTIVFDQDQKQYRATLDAKGATVSVCEKVRHRYVDMRAQPFDMRLALSTENPISYRDALVKVPTSGGFRRRKQRWSFSLPHLALCRVDMTRVVSANGATTYEVEFELMYTDAASHLNDLMNDLHQLYRVFFGAFNTVHPTATNARLSMAFLDIAVEPGSANGTWRTHVEQLMRREMGLGADGGSSRAPRFLGSNPVTFLPHYVPTIRYQVANNKPYYVAEKTDGVRYLLWIEPGAETAVLVNRAAHLFQVKPHAPFKTLRHPILLDGEMVRDVRTFKPVFLVFDVLASHGHTHTTQPFHVRQRTLATIALSTLNLPFRLVVKQYHPLAALKTAVFGAIQRHRLTGERLFRDREHNLVYRSDGVIFAPATPYRSGTDRAFYKYKYPDELTVEFAVRYPKRGERLDTHQYQLCLNTKNGFYVYRTYRLQHMSPAEQTRIRALLSDAGGQRNHHGGSIGEFYYDTQQGRWMLLHARADKTQPNLVNVLVDTLELLTQKITAKKLVTLFA